MKILQVTRQYYPAVGGIATAVRHLSQQLQANGHEVHILALNRLFQGERTLLPSEEIIDGILIKRIPYWGSRRYAIAPRALKLVKEYDLVHLHSSDFFLDYLAWTKLWHKRPLCLTSHGLFFHTSFARSLKQLYFHTITRGSLAWVSAIVCVSQHDHRLVQAIVPPEKLHLIPNGINYEVLGNLPLTEHNPDLLLSVGILTKSKRYDRLLAAFAVLIRKRPSAHLTIVGPDRGSLASLQTLSQNLGLVSQVTFAGNVSELELQDHLCQSLIWISASEYEGFGIALLEAMAAGCLPVVPKLPSFLMLLGADYAFFADFDNPEHTAEVIHQAIHLEDDKRLMLLQQIRQKAQAYAWHKLVQQVEQLYEKVLSSKL